MNCAPSSRATRVVLCEFMPRGHPKHPRPKRPKKVHALKTATPTAKRGSTSRSIGTTKVINATRVVG
jgi:hypothetical protein